MNGDLMNDNSQTAPTESAPIPADDPARALVHVNPDADDSLIHLGVVGDTYTILVFGADTAGRYTLIDMHGPPGGGPPPHRHDFEEMFTLLDGELEFTFRGTSTAARAGETINVPANAPHVFRNASDRPARVLCLCSPAGQEEFFKEVGIPVAHRTEPPPALDEAATDAFIAKATALAPKYRTELLLDGRTP
ncbi:MAG: cupin domain-containing protein [Solirubrobacterales bacterium]|nr:cupin domain-containing protein [Solirubrobacterales bacterium]